MAPQQEDHPLSRAHSGSTQCHSRCSRLEVRLRGVQGSESEFRSFYGRPFCQQEQCSAGEILQLSAGSFSRTLRCSSLALEGGECLRLPPFQLDQQVSEEDMPRRSNPVDCLPGIANTGLVPSPPTVGNKQSSIASNSHQLLDPLGNRYPLIVNNSLPLAGWRVSGITSLQRHIKRSYRYSPLCPMQINKWSVQVLLG